MLLLNRIFSNNVSIWVFSLILIILTVFLRRYYKKLHRDGKSLKLWRVLCFAPLALALFQFAFFRIKGSLFNTRYYFMLFYIASAILVIPALTSIWPRFNKFIHPLVTLFCILAGLHTIVHQFVWDSAMRNHTYQNYTDSFVSMTKDMEKYYSLKEWKKIDIPCLREKFLPVVQKAQETNDEGLFSAAMVAYAYNFFDGHVNTWIYGHDPWLRTFQLLSGNDYGMSMMGLSDGKIVAVQVDEDSQAYQLGIRDGTEIISWNGQEVHKAADEIEFVYYRKTFPVKANEDIFKPAMLATKGMRSDGKEGWQGIVQDLLQNAAISDDSQRPKAVVGFIGEDRAEHQVELDAIGSGEDRQEWAFSLLNWHRYRRFPDLENFHTVMINDDTAYMPRYYERHDTFYDILSYFTNHNPKLKRELVDELNARRKEGMKKLIIDARDNLGGFWAEGVETASLFTNESFEMARRGSELFGKTTMIHTVEVEADGRFSDIEVLLLVDQYCVSAGDSLVRVLSQCPNVTVMGLTPSNCSCQETGGVSYLSNGICSVVYPVNWLYELDGRRYIDTDETRECTVPIDVQIPLTWELLQSLYSDYETRDVILDYAVDYLKNE